MESKKQENNTISQQATLWTHSTVPGHGPAAISQAQTCNFPRYTFTDILKSHHKYLVLPRKGSSVSTNQCTQLGVTAEILYLSCFDALYLPTIQASGCVESLHPRRAGTKQRFVEPEGLVEWAPDMMFGLSACWWVSKQGVQAGESSIQPCISSALESIGTIKMRELYFGFFFHMHRGVACKPPSRTNTGVPCGLLLRVSVCVSQVYQSRLPGLLITKTKWWGWCNTPRGTKTTEIVCWNSWKQRHGPNIQASQYPDYHWQIPFQLGIRPITVK